MNLPILKTQQVCENLFFGFDKVKNKTILRDDKIKNEIVRGNSFKNKKLTGQRLRKSKSDKMFFENIHWIPSTTAIVLT